MEFKSPSLIKTKSWLPGAKNKKRSGMEAELGESSNLWDLSRFEYEVNQSFQTKVENHRVGKSGRVSRIGRADRDKRELTGVDKSAELLELEELVKLVGLEELEEKEINLLLLIELELKKLKLTNNIIR